MSRRTIGRRGLLRLATASIGAAALGGCDRWAASEGGRQVLSVGEDANLFVQRILLSDAKLAREYPASDISPWFKPNGTADPPDSGYKTLARDGFRDWRLAVDGLVDAPLKLSLADLRAMPARTQITRHDCVEGWSCIGQWTGVPLRDLLGRAGLKPSARYVVFHCADTMEGGEAEEGGGSNPQMNDQESDGSSGPSGVDGQTVGGFLSGAGSRAPAPIRYYESVDLVDAFHPQTILAYGMNGQDLPVAHGAPLRLRLERQLGYKMAKYVMRVEVVDSFSDVGRGRGGYWEDRGYAWYAGI